VSREPLLRIVTSTDRNLVTHACIRVWTVGRALRGFVMPGTSVYVAATSPAPGLWMWPPWLSIVLVIYEYSLGFSCRVIANCVHQLWPQIATTRHETTDEYCKLQRTTVTTLFCACYYSAGSIGFGRIFDSFTACFGGVHAFGYNSAESEPIWMKSGALWVYCWRLALGDFGCDLRSMPTNSSRGRRNFIFYQVSNARFHRFPSDKFHEIWTQHVVQWGGENFRNRILCLVSIFIRLEARPNPKVNRFWWNPEHSE